MKQGGSGMPVLTPKVMHWLSLPICPHLSQAVGDIREPCVGRCHLSMGNISENPSACIYFEA